MSMTPIEDFNRRKCELIPGIKVNAYVDIRLDPENPTGVILDSTWGEVKIDLKSIVKAGETVTRLYLAPETGEPEGLCYEKEDGTTDYIPGDELSRIISMRLLKDVDQTQPIGGGNVYMFNSATDLFEPYDLQTFINETNQHLTNIDNTLENHQQQINNAVSRIQALETKVQAIEGIIPFWDTDKTMKLGRGTINIYGDVSNTMNKTDGIFTHDKNTDKVNDQYFS